MAASQPKSFPTLSSPTKVERLATGNLCQLPTTLKHLEANSRPLLVLDVHGHERRDRNEVETQGSKQTTSNSDGLHRLIDGTSTNGLELSHTTLLADQVGKCPRHPTNLAVCLHLQNSTSLNSCIRRHNTSPPSFFSFLPFCSRRFAEINIEEFFL